MGINADWTPSTSGAWLLSNVNLTASDADWGTREAALGRTYAGKMKYKTVATTTLSDMAGYPFASIAYPTIGGFTRATNAIYAINAGTYDSQIRGFANAVKAISPTRTWIRLFWEFNLHGTTTNGVYNPINYTDAGGGALPGTWTDFQNAWIRVWTIFFGTQAQYTALSISGTPVLCSGSQVKFAYSPNRKTDNSGTSPADPTLGYPGSQYVDWIMVDTYPNRVTSGSSEAMDSLSLLVTQPGTTGWTDWYNTFSSYGKPLGIGETSVHPVDDVNFQYTSGVTSPRTRVQWWTDALAALKATYPLIRMVTIYDANDGGYPGAGTRTYKTDATSATTGDSGAQAFAAYKTFATDPYMAPSTVGYAFDSTGNDGGGRGNACAVDQSNSQNCAVAGDVWGTRNSTNGGDKWIAKMQGQNGLVYGRAVAFSKKHPGRSYWGVGTLLKSLGGGRFCMQDPPSSATTFDTMILTADVLNALDGQDSTFCRANLNKSTTYVKDNTSINAAYTNVTRYHKVASYAQLYWDINGTTAPGMSPTNFPLSARHTWTAGDWMLLDQEQWATATASDSSTPCNEQNDPATYIAAAISLARANGIHVISSPGRDLASSGMVGDASWTPNCTGTNPLHYQGESGHTGETLDAAFLRIGIPEASAPADIAHVQAQADEATTTTYQSLVTTWCSQVRAASPGRKVTAGLSWGLAQGTPTASQCKADADAVAGLVSGFWLNCASGDATAVSTCLAFLKLLFSDVVSSGGVQLVNLSSTWGFGSNLISTASPAGFFPRACGNRIAIDYDVSTSTEYVYGQSGTGIFRAVDTTGSLASYTGFPGTAPFEGGGLSMVLAPDGSLYAVDWGARTSETAVTNQTLWHITNPRGTPTVNTLTPPSRPMNRLKVIDGIVWLLCANGLFKLVGSSWTSVASSFFGSSGHTFSDICGVGQTMYVATGTHPAGTAHAVAKSTDGGLSWTWVTTNSNFDQTVQGTNRQFWLTDFNIQRGLTGDPYGTNSMDCGPTGNFVLLAGARGAFSSKDGGATWHPSVNGMMGTEVSHIGLSSTNGEAWNDDTDWGTVHTLDHYQTVTEASTSNTAHTYRAASLTSADGAVVLAFNGSFWDIQKNGVSVADTYSKGAIVNPTDVEHTTDGWIYISQFGGGVTAGNPNGGGGGGGGGGTTAPTTGAPTLSTANPIVGQPITVFPNTSTWDGTPPLTFTYQWQRK